MSDRTQREIAEQVGCSQQYVAKVKEHVTTSCYVSLPETRTDTLGRNQPTRKARKATFGCIGAVEAAASAKLFREHGARLAEHHALERAAAEAPAPIAGPARHAAEQDKRARLRAELRQLLDEPLHKPVLTPEERQAIRVAESLRRRPVGKP